jgi:hypothetical protein
VKLVPNRSTNSTARRPIAVEAVIAVRHRRSRTLRLDPFAQLEGRGPAGPTHIANTSLTYGSRRHCCRQGLSDTRPDLRVADALTAAASAGFALA